jgi:aspartate aminotransferase-like enzyme
MIIADGITAVGVESIDVTHIDALIAGSQKALMLPPGLAILGLSQAAIARIGEGKGFYFNLATEIRKQRQNTTAYTAATTLVIGVRSIMEQVAQHGGWESLYAETARRAVATRGALEAIGLRSYPRVPAASMTTIFDSDAEAIRTILKQEYGILIAGGQDQLKGKIFRINQMGLIPPYELLWVVNAVERALDRLGRRTFDATADQAFQDLFNVTDGR